MSLYRAIGQSPKENIVIGKTDTGNIAVMDIAGYRGDGVRKGSGVFRFNSSMFDFCYCAEMTLVDLSTNSESTDFGIRY
jgi:hypothetical protein